MANYASANLVKAQTIMTQMFNAGEVRYRNPVTFREFVRNGEIMIPSHKIVRTREDRPVEVNYWLRTSRALGTGGRIHNPTGARGDSGVLTPAFTTYDDTFVNSIKQADTSVYTAEQELANELSNVYKNFAEGNESSATTYLFNNRSEVNVSTSQGTFSATNFAFEITEATEGSRAVQITKTTMDINKYQGIPYTIFCDSIAYDKFESQANQGTGNSENLEFQFSNARFIKSLDLDALVGAIALTPYTKGFWIAVPEGMLSVLDWIPIQNRQGVMTTEGNYSSSINPIDGLSYAVWDYMERFDGTLVNGQTQDVKTEFEVSIDLSYQLSPLSTTDETPAQAFAFV